MNDRPPVPAEPTTARSTGRSRLKNAVFTAILVVGLPLVTMVFVEGASSGILFVRDALRSLGTPDELKQGIQYDSLVGWVGRPGVYLRDLWGPGVHYRSNALGFRSNSEVTPRTAAGRVRILCSGDSFTQGAGVDNDHTWCELLTRKHGSLESFNLGLGGYGVDQAYLRFKRDGYPLEHAVHVFAFITDDFRRMSLRNMGSAGKPTLALHNGALKTENVPVPRPRGRVSRFRLVLGPLQQLRTVQLLQRVKGRLSARVAESAAGDSATAQVVSAIIADLSAMSRVSQSALVLVYLPTLDDYLGNSADRWRERLRAASGLQQNIWYLDLVRQIRLLPPDSASFFIPYQSDNAEGRAHGHYTIGGNQWVADNLYRFLAGIPAIASRLKRLVPDS